MPLINCKSEKLTPAILKMYENNISVSEICKNLSLSSPTVKKVLELNKIILERKISDCKSRRLESKIMRLINKDISISKICEKLKLANITVKKVARANGVDIDGRIKAGKLKQKTKRNEQIYKMLLQGKKYDDISEKMNVTKQRVYQVAQFYNYSRWEESKKTNESIVKKIKNDIKANIPYQRLVKKYNLNDKKVFSKLYYRGLPGAIHQEYRNKRNKNIGIEYKSGKKAIEIINSKKPEIGQPQRIKGISNVYAICSKQGIYKYPKVGRRIDGGSFEDISVLRLVKKLREKENYSFQQIADYMNAKKHKTICGKKFNMANTRFKYHDALKEGL
jgi:DNA-binding CsgD family transcriptional regulator